MPRYYVNSMANFMIQGGMVSFTLQDQAVATQGGQARPLPPEDVASVVMREADFAQLVGFFNQHMAAYESQTGRRLGASAEAPPAPSAPPASQPRPAREPMKIRPRAS
ncbi:hypothetical protein LNKW23_05430 [Paralimibaculum aggregatum]|uniref:DUF3467 domain-containing protein n=1 Tax=Paralimibaculum aggregatum TaxID=3036245 RepID=A0ABQ6LD95_9RHOB|nr:hypothetical protein [Limibaculum sp. NKW23]GMG81330.1 hypothetical protein LNKW23_05430 [Limibaculum sp. NKW23]